MTLLGSGFAVIFAVLLATASIFSRRGLERGSFELLLLVSLAVATPIFLAVALLTTGFAEAPVRGILYAAVSAVVGSVVGRSFYFLGINYLGPGKSLSITATAPLYAAVLSVVVLDEAVTPLVAVGTVGIVLGIVGISRDARSEARRGGNSPLVMLLPAAGAVFAGVSVILRKLALETGLAPIEAGAVNMAVGLAVVAPIVGARHGQSLLDADGAALRNFTAASLLMALGFVFYFFGLRVTPASIFFPLVQTQPLFAVVMSGFFLGELEVITPRTVLGAILVVSGAAIVVVG